jgi:hypothetical protein
MKLQINITTMQQRSLLRFLHIAISLYTNAAVVNAGMFEY